MNMIEVDPKLFITCRLCLDELGMYQIVPSVQEQIKFCFDIEVQPFDGLPQLICKKCEETLSDFNIKKKKYLEKQMTLNLKVKGDSRKEVVFENVGNCNLLNEVAPAEDVVTSSQAHENVEQENITEIARPDKKIIETTENKGTQKKRFKRKKPKRKNPNLWHCGLTQRFYCKFCDRSYAHKRYIVKHLKTHQMFVQEHRNVYNKYCSISIEKIDNIHNKTGSLKTVVLDEKTVLRNLCHKNYNIKYSERNVTSDPNDVSSGEDLIVRKASSKRRRISSRDSTDTIVLDNQEIKDNYSDKEMDAEEEQREAVEPECINIIDSSDSECTNSSTTNNNSEKRKSLVPKYKTIKNIISVCENRYTKKLAQDIQSNSRLNTYPGTVETLLKHKILSIGRKIVNKNGFNCNGILRFMDYKNLDIDWKPSKNSLENNPIRILTLARVGKKNASTENSGWKKNNHFFEEHKDNIKVSPKDQDYQRKNESNADKLELNGNRAGAILPVANDSAVLYLDVDGQAKSKNVILNENPVANPKQLPKKTSVPEQKIKQNDRDFIEVSVYDPNNDNITPGLCRDDNSETCLPVITSTTSLAPFSDEAPSNKAESSVRTEETNVKNPPRIKVKPASELMAPDTLKNSAADYLTMNTQMPVRVTGKVPQYVIEVSNRPSTNAAASQVNSNMIMLHTVELPHCRTQSPFRYFQNLLQFHSISLFDCNSNLTLDFKCLIKFKVHYAEGSKDRPIVLCSSLMCLDNQFCIKIRDAKQEEINITKLSANWQWEILKTFRSDVSNKMLDNAFKLGRSVHSYTNVFIRLLKSIEMERIN